MLYQFHRQQKPGSVHATYLLGGTRRPSEPTESDRNCSKTPEEQDMQSSPFMGSSTPKEARMEDSVPVRCLTLVREEDFES